MGFKDYLFAGVDSLNETIDQALSEDKREMSKEKTRADAQVLNPGSNRSSELNETLGPKSCTAFSQPSDRILPVSVQLESPAKKE